MKCLLTLAFCLSASAVLADGTLSAFSSAKPGTAMPTGWALNTLPNVPNPTRFDLVQDEGQTVLRAVSDNAAATLLHKIKLNPAASPILSWRWKVSRVIASADLDTKKGDDYAARVYVLFDYPTEKLSFADRAKITIARTLYSQELPAAALCYVWDNRYPKGTRAWSAYTDRVRMIVLESGQAGQWQAEQRDIVADFKEAFGEDPPLVSAVALAADTDNTGESVTAWFGDVAFLRRPNLQEQPLP